MKTEVCTRDVSFETVENAAFAACPSPAVSVVVTLYNYAAYIGGCLDSVRASRTDGLAGGFEVVIVDDKSKDDSVAVVEKYVAASPLPIRLVKKNTNTGLADSRNIGLVQARAPFVFTLDADNEIRPDCLREHCAALAGTDFAAAYGIINRFDHATRGNAGTMSDIEWSVARLVAGPCIDAMAMVRKDAVLRLGGYSVEYGAHLPQGWEDYDLWLKLAMAGHAAKFIPKILSDYRVHGQSMLQTLNPHQGRLAAHFSRKFLPLVAAHNDLPVLFGIPRRELLMYCSEGRGLQFAAGKSPARFIHRLLGKKLTRSACKRLSDLFFWLHP
jgi:glycosyltransferase involved in cell wall biosynthesis